jgi:hypothetical protein
LTAIEDAADGLPLTNCDGVPFPTLNGTEMQSAAVCNLVAGQRLARRRVTT